MKAALCRSRRSRFAPTAPAWRAVLLALAAGIAAPLHAATLYLLTAAGELRTVDTDAPTLVRPLPAITGLAFGDALVAIDVRPQNQGLYALASNVTSGSVQLYFISPRTGVAKAIGVAGTFVDADSNAVPLGGAAVTWDIDFNPASDRLRVVNSLGQNFRLNPNSGAAVDGNLGQPPGSVPGLNLDGPINDGTTTVSGAAHTNNEPNNPNVTTLYTLDDTTNSLFIQTPANAGTQTGGIPIKLGASLLDFAAAGFDILPGVNVTGNGVAATSGAGFMVAKVGGKTGLYTIELANGLATFVDVIGDGNLVIKSCAVVPALSPAIALKGDGRKLLRFDVNSPGTVTEVPADVGGITITAGETLVGIDYRSQTGQLYGLGIDPGSNKGTLYLIDPQTAAATAVGFPGGIEFVDGSGGVVDFPDPGSVDYGFDFNPAVDRIRVVTATGLNFRINPVTGLAFDGDLGTSPEPVGTNPDAPLTGGGGSGTAYTDSFAQGPGGVTTQYTLDSTADVLFIQHPPNAGTLTNALALTLGGASLNVAALGGFDIPDGVRASTAGAAAEGDGYFVGSVGGITGLYRLNLATGVATLLGSVGTGETAVAGLTVSVAPPVMRPETAAGLPYVSQVSQIGFPDAAAGGSAQVEFVLRNSGAQALTYRTAFQNGWHFTVTDGASGTIPVGGSVGIKVTYQPLSAASTPDTETLKILSNDPFVPEFSLGLIGSSYVAQADDVLFSGNGPTRFQPLANDPVGNAATLIASVSDLAIAIGADGRTLIIPSGYTGTFTYVTDTVGTPGRGFVTVNAGTPATAPTKFNGILVDANGAVAAWASVILSARGVGSAKVVYPNARGAVVSASATVKMAAGADVFDVTTRAGAFGVDRRPAGVSGVVGLSFAPSGGGTLVGRLHAQVAQLPAAQTFTVEMAATDPAYPGGGYAVATVSRSGAVMVKGLMPDGNPFSAGTNVTDVSAFCFFAALQTGLKPPGTLGAEFTRNDTATTDLTGELLWNKPPQLAGARGTHPGGATNLVVTARGSLFDRLRLLPAGAGTLRLTAAELGGTETSAVVVTGGVPARPTGALRTWKGPTRNGTSPTGLFSATVALPDRATPVTCTGVYLQKSERAWGYLPGVLIGGQVELTVP